MDIQAQSVDGSEVSALRRFVRRATPMAALAECELCGEPIAPEHRHLLEVASRETRCVCQACSILFDRAAASVGKYRRIPDRHLYFENFQIDDVQWENLRIPVGIAFFFHSTPDERMMAYYPGPMGPAESLLRLDAWTELAAANPLLATMEPDVEALLVNRARGARQYFLVPIDECYRLVALIRAHWKGLSGGQEVWREIEQFFAALRERSRPAPKTRQEQTEA